MANPTMTLIATQTLGANTASVTFSSIPSTYNDLKLVISSRTAAVGSAAAYAFSFNGDSAANYSNTILSGNSSAALSGRASSQSQDLSLVTSGAGSTASTFGASEIYISNYNSTGSKPFFDFDVSENNLASAGAANAGACAHLYRGTSGISSITVTPNSAYFFQYSDFYLYGIKNS